MTPADPITPPPARVRRRQDWPQRFAAFIEERRHTPFAWGQHDCCLFACDGIVATTGLDPAAKLFRGQYHEALGAVRLLREHGGVEALAARTCAEYGWPELRTVRLAQRGDLLLCDLTNHREPALGLCVGEQGAFPSADGLVFVGVEHCLRAWRIG